MKRIIYKHKQIWKASIIALVLAAVFALSAENSFNGVKPATGVKFTEMLIFLSVCIYMLIVFDSNGFCRCLVGQEKAYTALSAAVV